MFAKAWKVGLAAGLACAVSAAAMGQQAGGQETAEAEQVKPLTLGDKAPALEIAEWVKGEPIEKLEPGNVYVVEFWATWCGPCIAGMPHVSELQREYKDEGVRVIGVNIWDDPANVAPFMKERTSRTGTPLPSGDELMDYTVGIEKKAEDGETGRMARAWMEAAGQDGIPAAFIIDKETRVAWIGHPMSMDEPLKQVVEGTWDIQKAIEKAERERQVQAQAEPLILAYRQAAGSGDIAGQLEAIDQLLALDEETFAGLKHRKLQILLVEQKESEAGYALASEMVDEDFKDHAMALNAISWMILTEAPAEQRDNALALRAAKRANELTESKDPSILDTLAKAYFESGDVENALKHQQMAVDKAQGQPELLTELEARLEEYRAAKDKG